MRLLCIGNGKLADQWQKTISRRQLDGISSCAGWQVDFLPFLLASDLVLHVAECERLPFVVIEALAAQLACAMTRDLASEIPLFSDDNVLFVDDVENLPQKLENSLVLRRIAPSGGHFFKDTFPVNKMGELYERRHLKVRQGQSNPASTHVRGA